MYQHWQDALRIRTRYQARLKFLGRNKVPRSDASIETSTWVLKQSQTLENQTRKLLTEFVKRHPMGWFVAATPGFSEHIAAAYLSTLDIRKCPVAGVVWRESGLDPVTQFYWNPKRHLMRRASWQLGLALVTFNDLYSEIYLERKIYETAKNIRGDYTHEAKRLFDTGRFVERSNSYRWVSGECDPQKYGDRAYCAFSVDPRECLAENGRGVPMLPPMAIHNRATRYMVKAFLAHLQYCWWIVETGTLPPHPYVIYLRHKTIKVPPQLKSLPDQYQSVINGLSEESY
jgi:hypothetical protein